MSISNAIKNKAEVLVADDDVFVRSHLIHTLQQTKDIHCLGAVGSFEELRENLQLFAKSNVVLLLDIDFRGQKKDGLYIAENLLRRNPNIKILILTVNLSERKIEYLLRLGVKGVLLKSDHQQLLSSIISVAAGRRCVSSMFNHLLYSIKSVSSGLFDSSFDLLAPKEKSVLEYLYKGKQSSEIAELLNISLDSVYVYKSRAFKKLGIKNDIELGKRLKTYLPVHALRKSDHLEVFNLSESFKYFAGNEKQAMAVFGMFIHTLPEFVNELKRLRYECSYVSMQSLVHKFFGGLCYVGAMELQALVIDLMHCLERADYSLLDKNVDAVLAGIQKLQDYWQALKC